MGFRGLLFTTGLITTLLSYVIGTWVAWVGIPLMFFAAILYFIDKE
mgnify:CR=1 FL=1